MKLQSTDTNVSFETMTESTYIAYKEFLFMARASPILRDIRRDRGYRIRIVSFDFVSSLVLQFQNIDSICMAVNTGNDLPDAYQQIYALTRLFLH